MPFITSYNGTLFRLEILWRIIEECLWRVLTYGMIIDLVCHDEFIRELLTYGRGFVDECLWRINHPPIIDGIEMKQRRNLMTEVYAS